MRKLGKKPAKHDYRTLHLSDYLRRGAIENAPPAVRYSAAIWGYEFGMLLNDQLGDCTIAGALHLNQVIAGNLAPRGTSPFKPTDAEALEGYERICGYNPNDPSTDQGGILLDVLNAWRQDGIGGRKIVAFAKVNLNSPDDVRAAIHLFGGLYAGVQLPISAQQPVDTWQPSCGPDGAPGSWGGHCVPVCDYTPYILSCVTWGTRQKFSWPFLVEYFDEGYVVVSQDWINAVGDSPTGLNVNQLIQDAQTLSQDQAQRKE